MAQISMTFDTKTKKASVTIDGKAVDHVDSMSLYQTYCHEDTEDGPKFFCSVTQCNRDKENGTRVYTRTEANEKGELATAGVTEDEAKLNLNETQRSIAAYLEGR